MPRVHVVAPARAEGPVGATAQQLTCRAQRSQFVLPALALVVDPPEDDVLRRPPRHPDEPMLGRAEWRFIITTGLLQAAATHGVFVWALNARDLSEARNLAFSVLVFGELFRAFVARSTTKVFWEVGAFTNVRLLGVVLFSVVMQFGIHDISAAQAVFEVAPLPAADCALTLLVALGPVTVIEVATLGSPLACALSDERSGAVLTAEAIFLFADFAITMTPARARDSRSARFHPRS